MGNDPHTVRPEPPSSDGAPVEPDDALTPLDPDVPDGPMLIKRDCPCVRCGYNLRGLRDDGQCPECGCRIERTLQLIHGEVLCPSCLRPAHPSLPNCPHCGGPLTAASVNAGLAAGVIHAAPRIGRDGEVQAAPLAPVILLWVIFGPVAIPATFLWFEGLRELTYGGEFTARNTAQFLVVTLLVALIDAVPVLVTRAYIRRRRAAKAAEASALAEEEDDGPLEPEEDPEQSPPPPA